MQAESGEDEDDWGSDDEEEVSPPQSPPPPSFSCLPLAGGRCTEHGVLLEVPLKNFATEKQLRSLPPLCYWVVG